ncbi:FusB/FusC family EF-G-binding protein [Gordoniibacillus kamchatkensis]|uniref:FusB/FusC family EF-G-binding protein n=1 Tax=Gordoniibacillus kamchatkensis TaxID=1590651 RepID=UPI001E34FA66|nr:FusB/FusC family EF-G-binding protein [Paenibacillus sp. VKM B-2647]
MQQAYGTVFDPKVVEAVKYSTQLAIFEAFPDATEQQKLLLGAIATAGTAQEIGAYLLSLEPYLAEFAPVTDNQVKKLFPKVKKLKVPDLAAIDYRYVTYLGWTDIATNKLFLVYRLDGQLVGIEGNYNLVNKKSICFLCNRHGEVALFSAITKFRPANASPDYYKAIGNYMCADSAACNKNITDVAALEKFIHDVVGHRH